MKWESFLDESYYDMFAVRPIGDKSFGSGRLFHFATFQDAEAFKILAEKAEVATESPESSVWPGEEDYEEIVELVENAKDVNDKYYAEEGARAAIQWLQSRTAAIRNDTIISDSDTVEKKLFSLLVRAKNQIDDACDCHEFVEEINRALLEYNQINGGIWYEVHSK